MEALIDPQSRLLDSVRLASRLLRCPSVTPQAAGALDVLQAVLEWIGFTTVRLPFFETETDEVDNLYARLGETAPNFCFAGHVDVVPAGDVDSWRCDPFGGEILNDELVGRGAVDMKGGIAAFVAAAHRFVAENGGKWPGSISFLITGDEEGPAINGTRKVLRWLASEGQKLDSCLVGEPTSTDQLGDMVKLGRRGSLNGTLIASGVAGHVGHPHLATNPIHLLAQGITHLSSFVLDEGNAYFQPSVLSFTDTETGNSVRNVIPAQASARFALRFNDLHSAGSLRETLTGRINELGGGFALEFMAASEAFRLEPGWLSESVCAAILDETGLNPVLSTSGGTSDARFIKEYCPVIEFGLPGGTMHQRDERVRVSDLHALSQIYLSILRRYFAA